MDIKPNIKFQEEYSVQLPALTLLTNLGGYLLNKLTIRMVGLAMTDNQLPQAPAAELIYTRANASLPIQGSLTDDKCVGNSVSGLFKTDFLGYTGCNITATPLEEAQPWRFFYACSGVMYA